jgi:hypothetical protein
MVGWTWHFPSVVEISSVGILGDNIKLYVEHDDWIYLAPNKFKWENATNILLGNLSFVLVQNFNSLRHIACWSKHVA